VRLHGGLGQDAKDLGRREAMCVQGGFGGQNAPSAHTARELAAVAVDLGILAAG